MVDGIKQYLHATWMGTRIVYEEEMESTNLRAKMIADENVMSGTLVVAKRQTAGRGRLGRNWSSPEGNAYFTLIVKPDIAIEQISQITVVAALALSQSLAAMTELDIKIKWPNDIVVSSRKLCGILAETKIMDNDLKYVIVGIGVNVNQMQFEDAICDMATSLVNETGKVMDVAKLIAGFVNCFEVYYEQFLQSNDLSLLSDLYNQRLVHMDQSVRVIGEDEMIGVARGIDNTGALLLEMEDGEIRHVIAGELSVRGLYGYV